jgi:hypothetical protein
VLLKDDAKIDQINNGEEISMYKSALAAAILAATASISFAANEENLTGKAMDEHPGTTGGSTAQPTAKPNSGSLSEKQMQDQPGVNKDKNGVTVDPNAVPEENSLAAKAAQDAPGATK